MILSNLDKRLQQDLLELLLSIMKSISRNSSSGWIDVMYMIFSITTELKKIIWYTRWGISYSVVAVDLKVGFLLNSLRKISRIRRRLVYSQYRTWLHGSLLVQGTKENLCTRYIPSYLSSYKFFRDHKSQWWELFYILEDMVMGFPTSVNFE